MIKHIDPWKNVLALSSMGDNSAGQVRQQLPQSLEKLKAILKWKDPNY